jgi:hypothetical protein
MSDDSSVDNTVNSILSQLKDVPKVAKAIQKVDNEELTKEKLESFLLQHTSRLIENATESVEYIKDNVQAAPTPEDVTALAELIRSASTSIDILNKLLINKAKNDTSVKIKEMDIKNKKEELDTKVSLTLTATREEMMRRLMNDAKLIDIKVENID